VIVPDGYGGLWASARTHWTGRRWQLLTQNPDGCLPIGGPDQVALVSAIPGSRTALASFECGNGLLDHAYLYASGPLP
jgi:hypothetical protein